MFSIFAFTGFAPQEYKKVDNIAELKAKILAKAKSTKNIHSEFVQEKHLSMFEEVMISKGEFYFQIPNSIRWQYNSPISYIIVMNGKTIQIKDDEGLKEYDINSNPVFKEINKLLLSSLNGKILESKEFKIEYFKANDKYMARLIPQSSAMSDVLSNIEIYFNSIDYGVTGIKLTENSEDFTIINFKQRIINGKIPDNTFKLRP
jgi:outer membrane lipoprotein carrier protein